MQQVSKDKAPLAKFEIRGQWTDTSNMKAKISLHQKKQQQKGQTRLERKKENLLSS